MSIGRNDPCPCGSGKKYKKCCLDTGANTATNPTQSAWVDQEGIHVVQAGVSPTAEELAEMASIFQGKLRDSPLWNEMVSRFGEQQAGELLKECKIELK